jgi:hypothetical protein
MHSSGPDLKMASCVQAEICHPILYICSTEERSHVKLKLFSFTKIYGVTHILCFSSVTLQLSKHKLFPESPSTSSAQLLHKTQVEMQKYS